LLEPLLQFIGRVIEHTPKNKMDLDALATVFAPNLLRLKNTTADTLMKDSWAATNVVMTLIKNRDRLEFKVSNKKKIERLSHNIKITVSSIN
jgi:hypothetical protein